MMKKQKVFCYNNLKRIGKLAIAVSVFTNCHPSKPKNITNEVVKPPVATPAVSNSITNNTATNTPDDGKLKIGYIVKQPEEVWFQTEWKFATKTAQELGAELIKFDGSDDDKTIQAISTLIEKKAKGFVICPSDTRLGPAIEQKANSGNLKVVNVDDRFLGPIGEFMRIPFIGMVPHEIGMKAGLALAKEWALRNWPTDQTAAVIVTYNQLRTSKERTDGIRDALIAQGFAADKIFTAPQRSTDLPAAYDAINSFLGKYNTYKYWLVAGFNDTTVLGAVRAFEGAGFKSDFILGIGINGTDCIKELEAPNTGFFGSILLSPKKHGTESTELLYHWIQDGVTPPLVTNIEEGTLITRDNYKQVLHDEGLGELLEEHR